MKTVIAVKAIGRTPPGGTVKLPVAQARALVAMGHAAYAPVKSKAPRQYKRRDMVAEPVTAPAPAIVAATPTPKTSFTYSPGFMPIIDDGKA